MKAKDDSSDAESNPQPPHQDQSSLLPENSEDEPMPSLDKLNKMLEQYLV